MAKPGKSPPTKGRARKGAASSASQSAAPITFDALCTRHGDLLSAQADEKLDPAPVSAFIADAAAAGVQIESVSERDAIRAMLNYWTATLARLPAAEARPTATKSALPPGVGRATLASFDARQSPTLDEKANPFVGLAPFDVGQSDVFFGRDKVVADLLALVRANPLVVVSGASGTGKSSLVRAGLTGAIRADKKYADWTVAVAAPGRDPVASLVAALAPAGPESAQWIDSGRESLDSDPAAAGALAAERMGDGELLLIVDQFEELFSLCQPEDQDRAASAIASIAALPRAHVVVTIRDEHLERERANRLLAALDLAKAVEFRIPPLDTSEIRAAIAEPAARVGLVFQDGLIDRIVAEVGTDPAALPLLQYALLRMWRKRQGNRITMSVYESVGGPATALARAAQEIYDGFVKQARDYTKTLFQRLVRPSLVYEFVRDRVNRGELEQLIPPENLRNVLKPFVDAGLIRITPGSDRSEDRIEIAHESLIRNWDPLRSWAGEVRDQERVFLEIDSQAQRWDQSGNTAGNLLFGKALKNAEAAHKDYLSRARVDPVANARVGRYLDASRTQQRRLLIGVVTAAVLAVLLIATIIALNYLRRSSESAKAKVIRESVQVLDQNSRLQAEASEPDEDAGRQFIQMLLTRGQISRDTLPPQFADMTPLATPLALRGWQTPFNLGFLTPFDDILPTIGRRRAIRLDLPNLRVFYDPETGTPLLAISQSDRSAPVSAARPNALFRVPDLAGQLDERALAENGMVLARLVDRREVAWGSQADRAARAVNLLPLMIPIRQRGPDPAQLANWSALSSSLRAGHNPAAKQVMYYSGAVPSARGEPPQMLWKVAVSIDEAERLVADAFTLPAKGKSRDSSVVGTLDYISAASGVDFSGLKAALQRASGAGSSSYDEPAQVPAIASAPPTTVNLTTSPTTVYIHVQGIAEEQATALRLALAGQGLRTPPIEQVMQCLSPPQLRFYHPEDGEAAARVAKLAGATIAEAGLGDGEVRVNHISLKRFPNARPGNLELWLCGPGGPKKG